MSFPSYTLSLRKGLSVGYRDGRLFLEASGELSAFEALNVIETLASGLRTNQELLEMGFTPNNPQNQP